MRGRRPGKPAVYSLEYIDEFSGPSATQMVTDVRRSRKFNVGEAPRATLSGPSGRGSLTADPFREYKHDTWFNSYRNTHV